MSTTKAPASTVSQKLEASENNEQLKYPPNLAFDKTEWIYFSRWKYSRPSLHEHVQETQIGNSIILPIPTGIKTGYGAEWSNTELGIYGKNLAGITGQAMSGGTSYVDSAQTNGVTSKSMGTMGQAILDGVASMLSVANAKSLGSDYVLGSVAESDGIKKAGVFSGMVRNPYEAVMFSSTGFRKFNFSWTFIPKNNQEMTLIRKIVKEFKVAMHPDHIAVLNNNFLTYPDIFTITMTNESKTFKIAKCALADFEVIYGSSGDGSARYYADGSPSSVTISTSFQELVVLTREDLEKDGY